MNWQAWRDFLITVFFLGVAFVIALLSSIAAEQRKGEMAAIAAAISLVMALLGALYIVPRLARNVRLEILRFAVRTTVTVEGLLFIVFLVVIAFAAWNTGNNLLYMVLSVMLAFLVAANLIARLSLVDVSVQLRFPDHMFAGEPANLTITLMNHKRVTPSYSMMVEGLTDADEGDEDDEDGEAPARTGRRGNASSAPVRNGLGKLAYFVLAPARSSVRQRVEYTFERRGCYPVTGFRLSTKFPAGFFKKRRRIDATGEILVYPKPRPLDDFYHALPMLSGQVQSHAKGSGDDLYSIRAYQSSDHMRHIDWKATAKSRQMMVREHMREDEWRLTIVFDTTRPDRSGNPEDPSREEPDGFDDKFERAIVMAASLANHFILERAEVELITPNEGHDVRSGTGHDHLYRILRSLATLQPSREAPAKAAPARDSGAGGEPRRRRLFKRRPRPSADERGQAADGRAASGWRLLDEVPVLADERRFKVLITSAAKGTIPANVWRSSHVVFIDDV
ncbi:MAG TPA: DUF58 domain-containing protein [Blastocatellia bacterium]|nr:DUF58 domain-containing protein [Blastocatellia bacterium]